MCDEPDRICVDCNLPIEGSFRTNAKRHKKCTLKRKKYDNWLHKYGVSISSYEELLRSQNYLCAICQNPPPEGSDLVVDHDHQTNLVRGHLCRDCNLGLGNFRDSSDSLGRAKDYLGGKITYSPVRIVTEVFNASKLAKCSRLSVGAAIVADGYIVSTGYNGPPGNLPPCDHSLNPTESCSISLHAEERAITSSNSYDYMDTESLEMWVTHVPCPNCARLLLNWFHLGNTSVKKVVYVHEYKTQDGANLLREGGVTVEKFDLSSLPSISGESDSWGATLHLLDNFYKDFGHYWIPRRYHTPSGVNLYRELKVLRRMSINERPHLKLYHESLKELPGWSDTYLSTENSWDMLTYYFPRELSKGRVTMTTKTVEGYNLGSALHKLRSTKRENLPQHQVDFLESFPQWTWQGTLNT